ncbi:hypothetical protein [Clostridium brassicae]|uniref:Uncharacterized protein n=1 Tax=Clostridium brassicae TaxID=2999072 RepID=A0ABT4D6E3_9CLOT|nr:hypothetical protein [Clostridium brassicae]MCY6957857.1 hypothetical protein [Clostridium brassicae]
MFLVKNKKTRDQLIEIEYGYNPNRFIQYCKTYPCKNGYYSNIKKRWRNFFYMILQLVITPFLVVFALYYAIQSLFPYCLVITKIKSEKNKEGLNV